jgi:hypothetical protein
MIRRLVGRALAAAIALVFLLSPGFSLATQVETGAGSIPGYIDFSYDKNTIIFPTTGKYDEVVFFDTIYPFDQTLRYKFTEPLVQVPLEHKTFKKQNVLLVALADLQRIYAPYFQYEIIGDDVYVSHVFYGKHVTAGATSRTPTIAYTKQRWDGTFSLKSTAGLVTMTTYETKTTNNPNTAFIATLDAAVPVLTSPPTPVQLEITPSVLNHLVYMPVASLMHALGKTVTMDIAKNHKGYLAISSINPAETTNDLFNPAYDALGGFPYTPITDHRVAYMDGVLNGTITKGNFWAGFYLGNITAYTANYPSETTTAQSVDRILPYRLYIPRDYTPAVPSKFTFELHGSTGNENAQLERANDHLTNQPSPIPGVVTVEDFADHYNYILLAPNGWTRGPIWGYGPAEVSLLTAFELLKAKYNIDPAKVFVTGNSAGGGGTMTFAARHTAMFRAMAPTAPAGSGSLTGPIVDLPTHYVCNAQDVTVPYAGNCIPGYNATVKPNLHNVTIQTIEEGHHSYGFASAEQIIFEFFDSVLVGAPDPDVVTVALTAGSTTAVLTDSANRQSQITLASAPVTAGSALLVGLADLATIYGPNFRAYNVYAYNTNPANLASVVTVKFNRVAVNIKVNDRFLRVGGTVRVGDTRTGSTFVKAGDPDVDPRSSLSVATNVVGTDLFVPVVEFMALFGKAVVVY